MKIVHKNNVIFSVSQGEYYLRDFYMNGTLLPQSVPNLLYKVRYDFYKFVPNRKWVATLFFSGAADFRKYRKRNHRVD